MAVNTYECLFLLDPNKASADWEAAVQHVVQMIVRHGGEIIDCRPWGEPKLAYPIKKFRKASYVLAYFRSAPAGILPLEAECRLDDMVLRQMVLKLHPQIAEEIVAHLADESAGAEQPQEAAGAT